jgi:hypothetical protein
MFLYKSLCEIAQLRSVPRTTFGQYCTARLSTDHICPINPCAKRKRWSVPRKLLGTDIHFQKDVQFSCLYINRCVKLHSFDQYCGRLSVSTAQFGASTDHVCLINPCAKRKRLSVPRKFFGTVSTTQFGASA